MATNYPTSLDDATSIPVESASTSLATNHVTTHQNVQDAIEAIEAKVGVDGSAVTTSHDYKLSAVTSTAKALTSGTSTQSVTGLTLASPIISTPKITVGSDAVGDLHYVSNVDGTQSRLALGTNGYILKSNGTNPVWGAETTTVDASATVKGVVEIATAAQITAGTATGETGAVIAISPDQLALSAYKPTLTSFTADGSISSGNVVAIGTGGNVNIYAPQAQDTTSVATTFINDVATTWGSLNFTVPAESNMYLRTVTVKVSQPTGVGSISWNADLSVRAVSGGLPTGADLANATQVAVGAVSSITFTFPTPYLLTASTTYALVFRGSSIGTDATITYWGQGTSTDSGGTWSSAAGGSSAQATTITYGKTTTSGRVFNANANNNDAAANGVVGFAMSTVTEGQSVNVLPFGIMTGLTGLTTGTTYYLSNTVGALSSSAGSQSRKIGLALSSTTLLIKHDNV